jgi:hypothetical protein
MSGASATRPALDRLLKDMRAGKLERVVCYKLDRMGRSLTHLALIIDEMARLNVPLICTTQGIDTSEGNLCGKFQLAVLMEMAPVSISPATAEVTRMAQSGVTDEVLIAFVKRSSSKFRLSEETIVYLKDLGGGGDRRHARA